MATSKRTVDALARRAAGRPISRHARADLDDSLNELEEVVTHTLTVGSNDHIDALIADMEALATDLESIVTRRRA